MNNKQIQIDIGRDEYQRYYLDINNERLLLSEKLGEIMDRLEKEAKKYFGIVEKKRWGWGK